MEQSCCRWSGSLTPAAAFHYIRILPHKTAHAASQPIAPRLLTRLIAVTARALLPRVGHKGACEEPSSL